MNALVILVSLSIVSLEAKTGFLFAHGLGGNRADSHWYKIGNKLDWYICSLPTFDFNFPEVDGKEMNNKKINLGQTGDIEAISIAHKEALKDGAELIDDLVAVGVSRGATTILNFAASRPRKMRALVCEAPFDDAEEIVKFRVSQNAYLRWIPGAQTAGSWLANRNFPNYDPNGIKPIKSIESMDKNLPIMLVHSKTDTLISVESSRRLYKKFKKLGCNHVYLLELDSGDHANYQLGKDADKYQATVHAFYKKYGITHDPKVAAQGERYLKRCQPK